MATAALKLLLVTIALQVAYALAAEIGVDDSGAQEFPFKLRITTLPNAPYLSLDTVGGTTFTGFIPDLIEEMSKRLGFTYQFYLPADNKYGSKQSNGEWNGMIGEVTKRQYSRSGSSNSSLVDPGDVGADMAAAPLTVTSTREEVIDFVKPFHHLGLTVVVQRPDMSERRPLNFSIFSPLSPYVWLLVLITTIVVGVLLGLLNRFNPYEWGGCYLRGQAQEHEKDSFSWTGSLWFTFTTMQWQGFERAPRSIAAKCLTCFWFFFVTLTLVTYIGALVNNLWFASMIEMHGGRRNMVTSLEDIVARDFKNYKIGCTRGGSTHRYVTEVAAPKFEEFDLIKKYWETDDGSQQLVDTTTAGIEKVRSGKYAFIMETMSARYLMNQKPCDLVTVGEQFASRSYGLAVPRGSPFLETFHKAILELAEEGEIDSMEQKWWEGQGECWNNTSIKNLNKASKSMYLSKVRPKGVDLQMYWGVLVVMLVGILLSGAIAAAEILYYRYRGRHDTLNRSQIQSLPKMENDDSYAPA